MIKKNTLHLWFCALLSFCSLGVMAQASMPAANPQANVSISLEGVTVYDPHYLWQYAVEQITKRSGQPTLEQISKEIELIYREDGYFLSNVTISRSQSKTSLIVYEGRISKIEVSGASKELATAIHDYVQAAVGDEAVTLEKFERGIMLARDLSGVSLTSEFVSSQGAGDDVVRIAVNAVKQRGSLSLDNLPRNFGKGLYAVLSEEVYST